MDPKKGMRDSSECNFQSGPQTEKGLGKKTRVREESKWTIKCTHRVRMDTGVTLEVNLQTDLGLDIF